MPTSHRTPDDFPADNEPVETTPDTAANEVVELSSDPVAIDSVIEPDQIDDADGQKPAPMSAHTDENKIPVTKLVKLWSTTILGIILLALLIVFIAQNQDLVTVRFFAMQGQLNLGLALFIAALGGALIVTVLGVIRVLQIRALARRERKAQNKKA
ncbi:LapA family protein [Glutamicibacter sp.]|uniref:LapA family protein n=1 Tax=Glutamicibacter sp. TaxID=1931995 RepID=UPI0028BE38CB|nr:LapA family protein [Glutamicibacter sp.]